MDEEQLLLFVRGDVAFMDRCYEARDFDGLMSAFSDSVIYHSHRALDGQRTVGSDAFRQVFVGGREAFPHQQTRVIQVRPPNLSSLEVTAFDDFGNEIVYYAVAASVDGRVAEITVLDDDAPGSAVEAEMQRLAVAYPSRSDRAM